MSKASAKPWTYDPVDGSLISDDCLTIARFHCGRNDRGSNARPKRIDADLIIAAVNAYSPSRDAAMKAAKEALRRVVIFSEEGDEDSIRLSAFGTVVTHWGSYSPAGIALLKLDAEIRAALALIEEAAGAVS